MTSVQQIAKVNNTELNYEYLQTGSGPVLVFVHGFTLDLRMWQYQFYAMAGEYSVLRYDLRGFGQSAVPDESPYSHADDLAGLLRFLGIEKAIPIGLSMGGGVVLDFAVKYPEMTEALVLVDGVIGGFKNTGQSHEEFKVKYGSQDLEMVKRIKSRWFQNDLFKETRERPEAGKLLKSIIDEYSGWHWLYNNPIYKPDEPKKLLLNDINIPTLILVGMHDQKSFINMSEIIAKEISKAVRKVIPKAGHLPNMDEPEVFNTLLADFLVKSL